MRKILTNVYTHILILSMPFVLAFIVTGCGPRTDTQASITQAQNNCIIVTDAYPANLNGVYCRADIQAVPSR